MHLLITNDDGYFAPGIRALARAAARRGHSVVVCAPHTQQSAKSQSITLDTPLILHRAQTDGLTFHSVNGTPVDAVRIGLELTDRPFDFCLSGINNGYNAGPAIYYSGTVAAAREAVMYRVPALAVSIDVGADEAMRENAARLALDLIEKLHGAPLPRGVFANLNLPALPADQLKETKVCKTANVYFTDGYERRTSPQGAEYFWLCGDILLEDAAADTDLALLREGRPALGFVGDFTDHSGDFAHLLDA